MRYLLIAISVVCLSGIMSCTKKKKEEPPAQDKEAALLGRWHTVMNISKDYSTGEVVTDQGGYDTTMSLNFQSEAYPGGPADAKKMYCYFDPMQRARTTFWFYDKASSRVHMNDKSYGILSLTETKLILSTSSLYDSTNYYFER